MVQPKPHQEDAVAQLENGKVLYGGVGSGKSLTALFYYLEREAPKDIYVITTVKKRESLEWQREAAKLAIGTKRDATIAGIIHVDSWNNIGKYVDREDAFFIFDEQRLVGNGAWVKAFYKIAKNNRWIMLTATPGDTWMDYIPLFIANGLYKNITQFKTEHVRYVPGRTPYPIIKGFVGTDTLEKYRNWLLVEMPYYKHTVRHITNRIVDHDEKLFDRVMKDRWHVYEDRPLKDVGEMFRQMRKVVNTDSSRKDALLDILEDHPKLIVFYNFDYELEILRELSSVVTVAEWNGHRKEAIPEEESWIYLVQYQAGAEGWNCTQTDTMVFWSLTYSWKNFEQAQGRIDRLDTPFTDLYYYVLVSKSFIDRSIAKSLAHKKRFNERAAGQKFAKFFDLPNAA